MPNRQVHDLRRLAAVQRSQLLDTPPDEPFDRLATLARDLMQCKVALVTVVDSRRSYWKARIGVDHLPDNRPEHLVPVSFSQYVVDERGPVLVSDTRHDPRTRDNPSVADMHIGAWAGYPVLSPDGQVLGSLSVMDDKPREWTDRDREVLATLARSASTEVGLRMAMADAQRAAERARRLADRSAHMALVLQRSMLTQPSVPDYVDVAVRYQPAAELSQVGGDWYDAFTEPDGSTVIVIGDVCGHDIDAAAMMGQLRSLVRGSCYDRADSPAQVLAHVDHAIRGLEIDVIATALIARIDPDTRADGTRMLRWSSAGHPPALVLSADGTTTLLDAPPELLLGIDPDTARSDHEVSLAQGDTLLLYTDGLVERPDRTIVEGLAELADVLATLGAVPLDDVCSSVLAASVDADARDDVALVAVRNRG
ncbi:MAG TPA: GAF domain-containing SpoIIE family protein phosphatase [Actinomycetales bacterium]|nr:GAF domain-containing SpoIIE family protein phosphatase [Actinomycetales bacterium]